MCQNKEKHISVESFCELLNDRPSSKLQGSNSIGLFVENDIFSNSALYHIHHNLHHKNKYLFVPLKANSLKKYEDLKLMLFKNILIKLLTLTTDALVQDRVSEILSSWDCLKRVIYSSMDDTLAYLLQQSCYDEVVILLDDLHQCDYFTLCDIQELFDQCKEAPILFISSCDDLMLKNTLIQSISSNKDIQEEEEKFYQGLFDIQYGISPAMQKNSSDYGVYISGAVV